MLKIINCITLTFMMFLNVTSFGQSSSHPKHENHYKNIPPIETSDYKIEVISSHSQTQFVMVKLKITNKTSNYIVYEPSETEFVLDHGVFKPFRKKIILSPWQYTIRTIKVSGDSRFHVDQFTLRFKGLYSLSTKGKTYDVPKFGLPNSTNYFEVADVFTCRVSGKIIKETKITEVPFRCSYVGENAGLIDASKLVIRLDDGREFATLNTGSFFKSVSVSSGDAGIVFPGDEEKVLAVFRIPAKIIDMQFANMEIDFKDAFMDAPLIKLYEPAIIFELDSSKTAQNNK